jgi:hypothetical protein
MIEPGDRTLSQVADWIGVTKGYASKIRYRLLHKSHALHDYRGLKFPVIYKF